MRIYCIAGLLNINMKNNNLPSDTFCILPYTHISSTNDGNYRICCNSTSLISNDSNTMPYNMRRDNISSVWSSNFYNKLRHDLESGLKPTCCSHCWKLEDQGVYSPRQHNNANAISMYPTLFTDTNDLVYALLPTLPIDLDIKIGSLCNLKCIMCYPGSSSLHQRELDYITDNNIELPALLKKWNVHVQENSIDVTLFNQKNLNATTIVTNLTDSLRIANYISIVGGEPFINPFTTELIDICIDNNYINASITIITNLSSVNTNILYKLDKFKNPVLYISYDHINADKFRYIRYPAEYPVFYENLLTVFKFTNIQKKFATTWGIFNIFDFEEIFDKWEQLSIELETSIHIQINLISEPSYFSIKYLPVAQKAILSARLTNYLNDHSNYLIFNDSCETIKQFRALIQFMQETPSDFDEVVTERTRVLLLYDAIRNVDHKTLFPAIAAL